MIGRDEDLMRDVYMTSAQREAYKRLRKDAERYRWLRDRMAVEDMPEEHHAWSTPSEHESAAFDSAVDARMQGANAALSRPAARGD